MAKMKLELEVPDGRECTGCMFRSTSSYESFPGAYCEKVHCSLFRCETNNIKCVACRMNCRNE